MTISDKIPDYITFPRTFEGYRWYKPILVIILSIIIMLILEVLILGATYLFVGADFLIGLFKGGIEGLDAPMRTFVTDLVIMMFIPSIYIASKIVKDRPFSSYSSSRGGWNFKLYFKALLIPLILYIIYGFVESAVLGDKSTPNLSIQFILVLLISLPLQCIAEEYVFRGLIMQTLGAWFKIPVLAIIIQAIIFVIFHGYNTLGLFEVLVMGLVLGFLTWKTNGIEVGSAMHTANNFSVGLMIMLGLKTSTSSPVLASVLPSSILILLIGLIMYYLGKRTDWFGEIPENSQDV